MKIDIGNLFLGVMALSMFLLVIPMLVIVWRVALQ